MRAAALDYVLRQRRLDRCLVPVLKRRCLLLDRLSTSNRALRRIIHVLAAAEAAKTAGSAVPVAGQITAALGEGALVALRAAARVITRAQDAGLTFGELADLSALRCGLPVRFEPRLPLSRPGSLEATLAGVPAPLEWSESPDATEIDAWAWDLRTRSFARCAPRAGRGARLLDGEHYELRLDHAPDKPRSRPSFF